MIDIVERLGFDAARCELQFSKGVASNIEEAAAAIKGLRSLNDTLGKNLLRTAKERDDLRAALSPFARHAHCTDEIQPSSLALWCAQALNALSDSQQKADGK